MQPKKKIKMNSSNTSTLTSDVRIIPIVNTSSGSTEEKQKHAKDVHSKSSLHIIDLNTYLFQYRCKGVFRKIYNWSGFNTRVELPSNMVIHCKMKYGLLIYLTIQEYNSHNSAVKIIRLKPILIPSFRMAKALRNKFKMIIEFNKSLPNPESHFFYKTSLSGQPN